MLEILGSLFGGGITGVVASIFTKYTEYKNQKRADAHEIKMAEVERETMILEQKGKIKIAVEESEAAKDVAETEAEVKGYLADAEMFETSHESDKASYVTGKVKGTVFTTYLFTIVDALRGSVRPLITYYIAFVLTWMAAKVYGIANETEGGLSPEQAFMLLKQIIAALIYIGTTVILWWFGTRPTKPPDNNNTDLVRNIGRSLSRMRTKF